MMSCRDAFQGEEALERLLRKAGSTYSGADLPALLAGVGAAPPGEDPDAWMELVAAAPSDALKAQLRAFRAQLANDRPAATSAAERVDAVRAELKRRGLAGF